MPSHTKVIDVITVDKELEKSKAIIEKLAKGLDKRYDIDHVANCETIEQIKHVLQSLIVPPKLLICSAYWFEEEAEEVRYEAQRICPKLALILIPSDLVTLGGEDTVVDYLKDQICESRLPTRD